MKKLFSLLTLMAFVATAMFAQPTKETVKSQTIEAATPISTPAATPAPAAESTTAKTGPKMTFDLTTMDYGNIEQNSDPLRTFDFVNDGTEPLVIKHAKGSCGCTVPKYPKEPIMPGESAVIEVRYDTKRIGPFNKSIRLTTNVQEAPIMLYIKGKVDKAPAGLPAAPSNLNGF